MYEDILDRYRKRYITDDQLAEYVRLNIITAEQQQTIMNDGKSRTLQELKDARIAQSKTDLETYLAAHPLQWTDSEYYSITAEKQNQLTSKIMAATMAQALSTDYTLTWNSTGEVCKEWTLQDLSALAFAIDARVTKLVGYQQAQEVAMRNAETLDELNAIVVDYGSVS